MSDFKDEILDAPISSPKKSAIWAKVGAAGIIGRSLSTGILLYYSNFFLSEISVRDIMSIPSWVHVLSRLSTWIILLGVVLTIVHKEPKSSLRSIVILLGALLLLISVLRTATFFYLDYFR